MWLAFGVCFEHCTPVKTGWLEKLAVRYLQSQPKPRAGSWCPLQREAGSGGLIVPTPLWGPTHTSHEQTLTVSLGC